MFEYDERMWNKDKIWKTEESEKISSTKKIFRFINYWLSVSSWLHLYQGAKACTKANMKQSYWDKWRWR